MSISEPRSSFKDQDEKQEVMAEGHPSGVAKISSKRRSYLPPRNAFCRAELLSNRVYHVCPTDIVTKDNAVAKWQPYKVVCRCARRVNVLMKRRASSLSTFKDLM